MTWVRAVSKEVWKLFVDDAGFAFSIVIWLAASLAFTWLILSAAQPAAFACFIFFAGFAALLIQTVLKRATKL